MIKVHDIAYIRFAAPDLDAMERFLVDFGLSVHHEGTGPDERLYARGTDGIPYVHVTQPGEARFIGMGFAAKDQGDLAKAAELPGASGIEKLEGPGGGERVRFADPDGFVVDVVGGRAELEPLPVASAAPINRGSERVRLGTLQRVPQGAARVKRLGHAVVHVSDFRVSDAWYKERFGFVSSDEIYLGDEANVITAFLRCDRGAEYTDHHTLLCIGIGEVGFDHAAFEVEDFDAVMAGHDHLEKAGYDHYAGVGRHILGSQIFDYWKDPWGNVLEHFADGDLLNDRHETALHDPAAALGTQWGRFNP